MDAETDLADNIKACRTCGIHFVAPSKYQLKHLFQSCQEHSEIQLIRLELAQWKIEVAENDGYPQYICNTCVHKFEQVFQLRTACINAQIELRKFYAVPNGNIPNIQIKSEVPDTNEEPSICDFIYVDELSDGEYDGATPFNIPHIPIKEEVIEAATVPIEESEQRVLESASGVVIPTDSQNSRENELAAQNDSGAVNVTDAALPITVDPIECNLCHQICSTEAERKQHLQVVHDIRDLVCQICGKEFKNSTSARLRFHMKWHNLNKQIKCNLCTFVCSSKDVLSLHKKSNHRKLTCKVCGKGVLAKKMKSHLQQHELEQKYTCEYCAKDFSTEDEMESHIWQIHANEDKHANSSSDNFSTSFTQPSNNETSSSVQNEENMCPEPQEDILYRFICAHCEHRFMEQIDLETHVNEEHRGNKSVIENNNSEAVDNVTNEEILENSQNASNVGEATLESYNNNELQPTNTDHMTNTSVGEQDSTIPPASLSGESEKENQNDDTELALNSSSDEESESEDETSSNASAHDDSNLKPFACAKCSQTFAAIEQLREHHEQHLAAEQDQQTKRTATKSKFQCNLCGKYFDLKFRLNRHFNKHKNHSPL